MLDHIGSKYGFMLILQEVERPEHLTTRTRYFLCRCDCGVEKVLPIRALRSGGTKSCGCSKIKLMSLKAGRHRHSTVLNGKSLTYETWTGMKTRCNNPNAISYPNYGGRGIKICDRWNNSFEAFLEDMGPRPSKEYSIDRIDCNAGYHPENCRWATVEEQSANRRNNRLITFNGITKTIIQWSRALGISDNTLRSRIDYRGWSVERAFTTPVRPMKPVKRTASTCINNHDTQVLSQ